MMDDDVAMAHPSLKSKESLGLRIITLGKKYNAQLNNLTQGTMYPMSSHCYATNSGPNSQRSNKASILLAASSY